MSDTKGLEEIYFALKNTHHHLDGFRAINPNAYPERLRDANIIVINKLVDTIEALKQFPDESLKGMKEWAEKVINQKNEPDNNQKYAIGKIK